MATRHERYAAVFRANRLPPSHQAFHGSQVQDHDRALAEVYQSLPVPNLKLFVDAFPTAARDVAKLALGQAQLDRGAMDATKTDALGELDERFGDARFEIPKDDVLDLFGRQPQFAAQDFKEDHANIGPV